MSTVAILGAGPIGSAIADRLAARGKIHEVRLVDAASNVAAGKALDIQQSAPIRRTDTIVTSAEDPLAAAGATVIVIADDAADGEWEGARGNALLERLVRGGAVAPIVFAGPRQTPMMESAYRDVGIAPHRLVGSAPGALAGGVRALAGLETNLAGVDLAVVGRPPAFVIGWSAAGTSGSLVTDRVAAHRLLAISGLLRKLWPPGPHAIGSATATMVEGLIHGSRRLLTGLVVLDGEFGTRGTAVALPLELGRLRVLSHVVPSLSPQERTEMINGLERH